MRPAGMAGLSFAVQALSFAVQALPFTLCMCFVSYCNMKKRDRLSDLSFKTGDVLLSQAVTHQVSSALWSLTSVFGMGTGVASTL